MASSVIGSSKIGGSGNCVKSKSYSPKRRICSVEIQITAANLRFAPAQIAVKPGEMVRFVVTNTDSYLHNFVGQDQEAGIPSLNLPGNTTQTVTWTAPNAEGTYPALCTLHPGMSLTITVKD